MTQQDGGGAKLKLAVFQQKYGKRLGLRVMVVEGLVLSREHRMEDMHACMRHFLILISFSAACVGARGRETSTNESTRWSHQYITTII